MRGFWLAPLLAALAFPVSHSQHVDPAALAAHDAHQGILVACDPYRDPDRVKKVFGKDNPFKAGILPIEVYVRNSTRWPVAITLDTIRLDLGIPGQAHQELDPMSPGNVATAILHPQQPNVRRPRIPLPLPGIRSSGKKWEKLRDKLLEASLQDGVVAPGATVHGFFYFNFDYHYDLVKYSRFVVPDLKYLGNTQAIMFFEVNLATGAPAK